MTILHNLHTNLWIGCLGIGYAKPFTPKMEQSLQTFHRSHTSIADIAKILIHLESQNYLPRFLFQLK